MPITIENPTPEAIFQALQTLPPETVEQLTAILLRSRYGEGYQDFWTEEDIEDFRASTGRLIEKRLGEEKYDYD